jgi:hypothetical protein
MRHLILIVIILLFIFVLSDDKRFVQGIMNKLYKNRSVQLLLLLIMFYLVYNNYPLTYTIPFAGLFFLAVCGAKVNFHELFNKRVKKLMEGFEGLGKMLESGEEDEYEEGDEYEAEEDEEEDRTKMLDELLDKMDEQYTVLEEAHKQQIEKVG